MSDIYKWAVENGWKVEDGHWVDPQSGYAYGYDDLAEQGMREHREQAKVPSRSEVFAEARRRVGMNNSGRSWYDFDDPDFMDICVDKATVLALIDMVRDAS